MSTTNDIPSKEAVPLLSLKTDVTLDEGNAAVEVSIPVTPTTNIPQEVDVTMEDRSQISSHPTEADLVKACEETTIYDDGMEDRPLFASEPTEADVVKTLVEKYA